MTRENIKVGGLDLSRHGLDRDLDLDVKKKSVSTVETKSRRSLDMAYALKSRFLSRSRSRLSISTLFKTGLDCRDKVSTKSRLVSTSRPPSLENIIARMVSSNNKIVSSRFFEQSQFEQFTMSLFFDWSISKCKKFRKFILENYYA